MHCFCFNTFANSELETYQYTGRYTTAIFVDHNTGKVEMSDLLGYLLLLNQLEVHRVETTILSQTSQTHTFHA